VKFMTMSKTNILLCIATWCFVRVASECPNACSGHGLCGSYDMCTCDRNWQGSDCSQRTCPFGLAHVDTPKGDLDGSTTIGEFNDVVIPSSTVYPYGTTEGFPHMVDSAGNVQGNTGHAYMECSNKGLCDRLSGECECLTGYDGAACQRASCPSKTGGSSGSGRSSSSSTFNGFLGTGGGNSAFIGRSSATPLIDQCSGHGTCETIAELAYKENQNVYNLWDKDSSMGCKCDSGYAGADCSERQCKYGIDPLYTDDATARVTHTKVKIESSDSNALSGEYALKFHDIFGEDHITAPLVLSSTGVINSVNHCVTVVNALKTLPNGVVPSVTCSQSAINTDYGFHYTLTFTGNPGKLPQLEIDQYLDGTRSTILAATGTFEADVATTVIGETKDYFPTRCEGLTVKVLADSTDTPSSGTWSGSGVHPGSIGYLTGKNGDFTTAQAKLLKACLGDSDYDIDNNVDVANWDKGVVVEADGSGPTTYNMIGAFPHAIKVVPVESSAGYTKFTYGEHHLVWYDESASTGKEFRVANLNNGHNQHVEATESYVYTTKGTVQQMGHGSDTTISDNTASGASSTRVTGYFDAYSNKVYTNYDTSCENQPAGFPKNHKCVEKGDKLFIIDSCWGAGDLGAGTTNPTFGGVLLYNCADSNSVNYNTGNLYTVTKVYTVPLGTNSTISPSDTIDISSDNSIASPLKRSVDTNIIEVDGNIGWRGLEGDPENTNLSGADSSWSDNTGIVTLFHFTPSDSYEYVSQCSNRGLCDSTSGLCQCFKGYTGDDCGTQNALAV